MSIFLRRRGGFNQPQTQPRLRSTHPLAKDITFLMAGSNPFVNAANGSPLSISKGGIGFSQRATALGTSLYTPDDGWADIAVGQDWAGPNTVIMLCRVNGIDSPWGGLFSKDTGSGTSSQFNIGRYGASDNFYAGVNDFNGNYVLTPSSIAAIVGSSVLAFTHSGAVDAPISYYLNGSLVGTNGPIGTQLTGTGVLGLGRSRDFSATYDSDVDWILFVRANRVLSAGDIKVVSSNLWSLLEFPAYPIYFPDSAPPPPPAGGYGFIKVAGSWKTLSGTYVKVAGVWKNGHFSPKVSGSWKTLI